jgi:hypothetical protein
MQVIQRVRVCEPGNRPLVRLLVLAVGATGVRVPRAVTGACAQEVSDVHADG